jgi:hypothetical protein
VTDDPLYPTAEDGLAIQDDIVKHCRENIRIESGDR